MTKLIRKQFTFEPELEEQLRKIAYVRRVSQNKIIKDALRFYFKTLPTGMKDE